MSLILQDVAARFGGGKPRTGGSYQVKCPCHDDNEASLTISEGKDGKVVLHCHAGCNTEDILRAKGLTYADISPNGKHPTIVAEYDYRNEAGELVYQIVRYEPKAFKQRRPGGKDGWIWNMEGIEPLPYRLPELLQAAREGKTIYIAEGEKDVDNLWKIGIPATTNHGGAGNWQDTHSRHLKGADVVILPDNDDAGRKRTNTVVASLKGLARQIRVLELPSLPEKGDVSDWIGFGGTADQLLTLASNAPLADQSKPVLKLYTIDELMNLPPIAWLILGRIPAGALIMLYGESGVGKSFLALDFALNISQDGVVVYIALEGLNGYPDRVTAWGSHFHKGCRNLLLTRDPLPIEGGQLTVAVEQIKSLNPRLVVIDTLARCMAEAGYDENNTADMGRFVAACDMIRGATGAAVVVVHHKGRNGDDARGSTALRAACDVVIKVDNSGDMMTVENNKMKDADEFPTYYLRRITVEARPGQTSCALVPAESIVPTLTDRLSKNQRKALDYLYLCFPADATHTDIGRETKVKGSTLSGALKALKERGFVTPDKNGKRWKITPAGAAAISQALPESQGDMFDPVILTERQQQRTAAEPYHIKDVRIELAKYVSGGTLDQVERYAKGEGVTDQRLLQTAWESLPPAVRDRIEATRRNGQDDHWQIETVDGETITAPRPAPII